MSYIITARVYTKCEENFHGDLARVNARVLDKNDDGLITFDIPGEFGKQQELTLQLCKTLIDAGFVSFDIGHSY